MRRFLSATMVAALVVALVGTSFAPPEHAGAAYSGPVISEFMASNTSGLTDAGGGHPDWIEVWNPTAATVNLAGWHLRDSGGAAVEFTFASPTTLAAGARLVVLAGSSAPGSLPNTGFGLGKGGDYLGLIRPDGSVAYDYGTAFPAQADDISYGISSSDVVGSLLTPTPGAANSAVAAAVAKPTLSRSGGYISGPVSVTAATSTPGATLRFTVDGSEPTGSSPAVSAPIVIPASSTRLRVRAFKAGSFPSQEATATFLFLDDVLAQGTTPPPGWPGDGEVNGQHFVYGFDAANVAANRVQVAAALQALPTVSIVTDQANLTGPGTDPATSGNYVNAAQSGSAWEKPTSVEYIDGANSFQINAGLRIRGGYSRSAKFAQHAFSLRFTNSYEGPLTTAAPLFNDGVTSFVSLDLRSENSASWQWGVNEAGRGRSTFLREIWSRDTQQATGQAGLKSRWVQVFLNGRFWGVYMLQERLSKQQAAATFGGDPNSYNILKAADDASYEAEEGNDADWQRLWALTQDQVVNDAEYAEINALVDLNSLATFQVINAYSANLDATPAYYLSDWLGNNWAAVGGNGRKYQFLISDAELSLGSDDLDVGRNRLGPFPVLGENGAYQLRNFNPGWLHSALLSNNAYRLQFGAVAAALTGAGGVLSPSVALDRWSSWKSQVQSFVYSEAARWGHSAPGGPYTVANWVAETNWVETQWFPARTAIFQSQVRLFLLVFAPGTADGGIAVSRRLGDAHPQA